MAVNQYGIVTRGAPSKDTGAIMETLTGSVTTEVNGDVTFFDFAADCLGNKGTTLKSYVKTWAESKGLTVLGMGMTPAGSFRVATVTVTVPVKRTRSRAAK